MSTVTGYAVYDLTLERFVTGVARTEAQAEKLVTEVLEGHDYETRKV